MRKQHFFKGVTVVALAGLMMAGTAITSLAAAGRWEKDDIGWWWKRIGGGYPIHTWEWIDGNNDGLAECYYFDENGYLYTGTTLKANTRITRSLLMRTAPLTRKTITFIQRCLPTVGRPVQPTAF